MYEQDRLDQLRQRARNAARARLGHGPEFSADEDDSSISLSSDGASVAGDDRAKAEDEEACVRLTNQIMAEMGCSVSEADRLAKERRPDLFLTALKHSTTAANVERVRLNSLRHGGMSLSEAREEVHGRAAGTTTYILSQSAAERMVEEAVQALMAEDPGLTYAAALDRVAAADPAVVKLALGREG